MKFALHRRSYLHLREEIDIQPAKLLKKESYSSLEDNKRKTDCAIFAYGHSGKYRGYRFRLSDVQNKKNWVNIQYYFNIPTQAVAPGDSGGGYYCKNPKGEWRLVGIISQKFLGSQMAEAESLFNYQKWLMERSPIDLDE